MRAVELYEDPVLSSWIDDLEFEGGGVRMTLLNGKSYFIAGMTEDGWRDWIRAASKGKHWHRMIKGNY